MRNILPCFLTLIVACQKRIIFDNAACWNQDCFEQNSLEQAEVLDAANKAHTEHCRSVPNEVRYLVETQDSVTASDTRLEFVRGDRRTTQAFEYNGSEEFDYSNHKHIMQLEVNSRIVMRLTTRVPIEASQGIVFRYNFGAVHTQERIIDSNWTFDEFLQESTPALLGQKASRFWFEDGYVHKAMDYGATTEADLKWKDDKFKLTWPVVDNDSMLYYLLCPGQEITVTFVLNSRTLGADRPRPDVDRFGEFDAGVWSVWWTPADSRSFVGSSVHGIVFPVTAAQIDGRNVE